MRDIDRIFALMHASLRNTMCNLYGKHVTVIINTVCKHSPELLSAKCIVAVFRFMHLPRILNNLRTAITKSFVSAQDVLVVMVNIFYIGNYCSSSKSMSMIFPVFFCVDKNIFFIVLFSKYLKSIKKN